MQKSSVHFVSFALREKAFEGGQAQALQKES